MNFPNELRYTKDHEWLKVDAASKTATMGITDFAQKELGDVVFVELPANGKVVRQGETLCVVESTKAASDVYSPVGGTVAEVNKKLPDSPESLNNDPYNNGWMVKLKDILLDEVDKLMTVDQYKELLKGRI